MTRSLWVLSSVATVVIACGPSPVSPVASTEGLLGASPAPIETPFFDEIPAVNPCTGEEITIQFTGTERVRATEGQTLIVAKGTVETSDGYSGRFNQQLISQGDRVVHVRFHDMEVNNVTGQRVVFSVGLFHQTTVDGETVVSFEHFSGPRCVG